MRAKKAMTEILRVRCTPMMKLRLERIAESGAARELSDHVRYALERYVESEEHKLRLPPLIGPAQVGNHVALME